MKQWFQVTFVWDADAHIYCTNLAKADSAEAVELYYERKYHVMNVKPLTSQVEIDSYVRRGMPVTEIN